MKIIRGILVAMISSVLIVIASLYLTGNKFLLNALQRTYFAGHKTANINDHTAFKTRQITAGTKRQLKKHERYNEKSLTPKLLNELNKTNTAAYLVLHKGKLIAEHYLNGYNGLSKTNSFSMAKTVTALLLGIAIDEGHIESLDQPITDFIPAFNNDPLAQKVTIGQLAMMNSGYEWNEHYYNIFSPTVELYYGNDVSKFLSKGHFSTEPGSFWEYSSASTQLMGIFLTRALRKAGAADNLSDYLSYKLWQPLGMNDNGVWHTDGQGMELTFCCINTNARNFAKLGLLMMNQGNWQGTQLVSADFIKKMTSPVATDSYGLSTWLSYDQDPEFYWFSGLLGQYIVNVPEHDLIIIRLGETIDSKVNYRFANTIADYIRKYYLSYALSLIE